MKEDGIPSHSTANGPRYALMTRNEQLRPGSVVHSGHCGDVLLQGAWPHPVLWWLIFAFPFAVLTLDSG
jgi:hypothetical protein